MHPRFRLLILLTPLFVLAVLLLDREGAATQFALGIAVAGFVWLASRGTGIPMRQILLSVAVASTGEVILSLGWRLYSYKHAIIPLYVPPGHALFYFLAAYTARQPVVRDHDRIITRAVLIGGSVIALASLIRYGDAWGFLWWLGALALMLASRNQLMLATCFVYTMLLEWTGTAMGNWRWAADVPFVGLRSANPPAGAGILYVLLDLIVVARTFRGTICSTSMSTERDSASVAV